MHFNLFHCQYLALCCLSLLSTKFVAEICDWSECGDWSVTEIGGELALFLWKKIQISMSVYKYVGNAYPCIEMPREMYVFFCFSFFFVVYPVVNSSIF